MDTCRSNLCCSQVNCSQQQRRFLTLRCLLHFYNIISLISISHCYCELTEDKSSCSLSNFRNKTINSNLFYDILNNSSSFRSQYVIPVTFQSRGLLLHNLTHSQDQHKWKLEKASEQPTDISQTTQESSCLLLLGASLNSSPSVLNDYGQVWVSTFFQPNPGV